MCDPEARAIAAAAKRRELEVEAKEVNCAVASTSRTNLSPFTKDCRVAATSNAIDDNFCGHFECRRKSATAPFFFVQCFIVVHYCAGCGKGEAGHRSRNPGAVHDFRDVMQGGGRDATGQQVFWFEGVGDAVARWREIQH